MSGQTSPPQDGPTIYNSLPSDAPDTSLWSALRYGTHNALAGFGNTLKVAGAPELGADVAGLVDAPVNYQPASDAVALGMKQSDWEKAVSNLPRAILEQAPDLLGAVGSGAVGSAVAGPVGGVAGTMAYYGGRDYGDDAAATAQANGHATPTHDDLVSAGEDTALMSAAKAIGLRGAGAAAGAVAKGAAGVARGVWDTGAGMVKELGPILDDPEAKEALLMYTAMKAEKYQEDASPDGASPMIKAGRWAKAHIRLLEMGLIGGLPRSGT
jgi:hypothetical protein